MQPWSSSLWLAHLLPTRPPQRRWTAEHQLQESALTESNSMSTTLSPGNRQMSDLPRIMYNGLFVISIIFLICLLFFCLCNWCKIVTCRQCCCCCSTVEDDYDQESGADVRDSHGRRGRRGRRWRSNSRRHRVAPARRATTSWLTELAADGRFPTPPPSYFESVDRLGMPPTPPPGYSSSARRPGVAAAGSGAPEALTVSVIDVPDGRQLPTIVIDAADSTEASCKPAEELAAPARPTIHRSCPNIRLVAPAPVRTSSAPDSVNEAAASDA